MSDDSKAKKAKITEEHRAEARRLKAIWDAAKGRRRSQAEFGDAYGLGNQSNVGHYLHARSPLNLKAASAFAVELNCSVKDFSPRIALEMGQLRMGDSVAEPGAGGTGIEAGGAGSSPKGGKTHGPSSVQTAKNVTSGEAGEPSNVAPGPDLREARYPVISWVQAGEWSEAVDTFHPGDAEEWMASPKELGPHGFILRVKGDSMTNPDGGRDNFPDGMLIHVQPEADVAPGDYVIAKRIGDGEATFKRLVNVDGELFLQAINPAWPKPFIKLEPGDKIVGKVKHSGWDF